MEDLDARRSAIDLREQVDAVVPAIMTAVEEVADRVRAEATDPVVRRRALSFKIDLVPVVFEAGFRTDPLAAALDLWLLAYQMEGCVDAGTGPCDFGAQQALARHLLRRHREALDRRIEEVTLNREALDAERQLVRAAAERYPLSDRGSLRRRRTITTELSAAMQAEALSPFELLGDVSTTLASLSSRLNLYIEEAARLARWQAELLAEDVVAWPSVDRALGDVGRTTASVEQLSATLNPAFLGGLLVPPVVALREERLAAMDEIDRQRQLVLADIAIERRALVDSLVAGLMAGVDAARTATLADLRQERLETVVAIEQLRRDLVADALAGSHQLVDHVAWRLAQLLMGVLVIGAIAGWVFRRRVPAGADR